MPTELSESVTVQMRLPVDVLAQMRAESERDLIPLSMIVRRSCVRQYGRGSVVPDVGMKDTESVHNIPEADGND